VSKITSIAEKFAPSSMWFLQTMTEVGAPSLRTAALAGTRDGLPAALRTVPSVRRTAETYLPYRRVGTHGRAARFGPQGVAAVSSSYM
jgi:hypothetical protein